MNRKGLALGVLALAGGAVYLLSRPSSAAPGASSGSSGGSIVPNFGDWFQSLTETPEPYGPPAPDTFDFNDTGIDPFGGSPMEPGPDWSDNIGGAAPSGDPIPNYDYQAPAQLEPAPDWGALWGLSSIGGAYGGLVDDAAARYGVRPQVIAGIIQKESGGNPTARNPSSSARGLMGMTKAAAIDAGADWNQLDDPAIAIDAGTYYLAMMINRFGETDGIRAYFAGPGTVARGTNTSLLGQADAYAASVLAY